jgi:class 3 adenylate cyclase/DNA-binding winged helix-turn-helix (wHTH) protein
MLYRFHDYTLDPAGREVQHGTQRLALEPQVFRVLLYLVEHRDRVVPKAELLAQCWPETFVSESALTRCLARLRQAVPPRPPAPPIIETRHRQGYRFVADVTVLSQAPPPAPVGRAQLPVQAPLPAPAPTGSPLASATPLPPPSPARVPLPAPPTVTAERRQLTVLCCDVVDAPTLPSQLDPEDWRDVMGRYHATCTTVITRYGGHIAHYLGDGLLGYFGWPQAHEDDARRAVHAGVALVTAVRDLSAVLVREYGIRLAIRIGIHTGLVVMGTGEGDTPYDHVAVGVTPTLAAQMQRLAAPDTVVLSEATLQLVQGSVDCAPVGTHTLPGTTEPRTLYEVRGVRGGARVRGRHPAAADPV